MSTGLTNKENNPTLPEWKIFSDKLNEVQQQAILGILEKLQKTGD